MPTDHTAYYRLNATTPINHRAYTNPIWVYVSDWPTLSQNQMRTGYLSLVGDLNYTLSQFTSNLGNQNHAHPAIADLDGDGKQEIVVVNGNRVFAMHGNLTLIWSYTNIAEAVNTPVIKDIDNDGVQEVLVATFANKLVALNGLTGALEWSYTTSKNYVFPPVITDSDDDGEYEIIFGDGDDTFTGGKVYVLDGGGQLIRQVNVGGRVFFVAAGDVDQDGRDEVIVPNFDSVIALNPEDGTYVWQKSYGLNKTIATPAIVAYPINGIETPVVVVPTWNIRIEGGFIYIDTSNIMLLDGSSGETWRWWYGPLSGGVSLADLNGDGWSELLNHALLNSTHYVVEALDAKNRVNLWHHIYKVSEVNEIIVSKVAVGDVDNDGGPELAVGSTDGVLRILNRTGGLVKNYSLGGLVDDPVIGDVDDDGKAEIVAKHGILGIQSLTSQNTIKNRGNKWGIKGATLWRAEQSDKEADINAGVVESAAAETGAITILNGPDPDLTLNPPKIYVEPAILSSIDTATITVTVHNRRTDTFTNKPFVVSFYDDDQLIGNDIITAQLTPGGKVNATVSWSPRYTGRHIVKVVVDSQNSIRESDETNNEAEKEINVVDKSPPAIAIYLPANSTYAVDSVALDVSASDPSMVDWLGYSLDGAVVATMPRIESFTDGKTDKNLSYSGPGFYTEYVKIPKNATVTRATLHINGYTSKSGYSTWTEDSYDEFNSSSKTSNIEISPTSGKIRLKQMGFQPSPGYYDFSTTTSQSTSWQTVKTFNIDLDYSKPFWNNISVLVNNWINGPNLGGKYRLLGNGNPITEGDLYQYGHPENRKTLYVNVSNFSTEGGTLALQLQLKVNSNYYTSYNNRFEVYGRLFYPSGSYESTAFDSGSTDNILDSFSWGYSNNYGGSLAYKTAGSMQELTSKSFSQSVGIGYGSNYIGETDRWFAYKIDLKSSGIVSEVISSVSLRYYDKRPSDVIVDTGSDGIVDWSWSGELNSTNSPRTVDLNASAINEYVSSHPAEEDGTVSVPLRISSNSKGVIGLSALSIEYPSSFIRYTRDPAFTNLDEGSHHLVVKSNDTLGNIGEAEVRFSVEVPPVVTIFSPKNTTYASSTIELKYGAVDKSGVAWTGYSLDGQAVVTITGDTMISGISDGGHKVTLYATDTRGNGNNDSVWFTVDTTPPTISDLRHTPVKPMETENITISASVKDNSGVASVWVHYSTDNWSTSTTKEMKTASQQYYSQVLNKEDKVVTKDPSTRPKKVVVKYKKGRKPSGEHIKRGKGKEVRDIKGINTEVVEVEDVEKFVEELRKDPDVLYVQEAVLYETLETPSDPFFIEQWNMRNIGVERGWDYSQGEDVKIALLDTGVDYLHTDLDENLILGYDWVNEDNDPMDDNGHGTHVAGVLAAEMNGWGIVGVAPRSKIIAYKVLDSSGLGYDADVASAIVEATDKGADVITLSLGGGYSRVIEDATDYAYSRGVLIVAAAGNDGGGVMYPAALATVIAVSALNSDDTLASYSSRGPEVELSAPGGGDKQVYSTYLNGGYAYAMGTSVAAPHVSGVAALLKSLHPDWSNVAVREYMRSTANDLGVAGRDDLYGYGLIDASRIAENLSLGRLTSLYRDDNVVLSVSVDESASSVRVSLNAKQNLDEVHVRDNITLNFTITNISIDRGSLTLGSGTGDGTVLEWDIGEAGSGETYNLVLEGSGDVISGCVDTGVEMEGKTSDGRNASGKAEPLCPSGAAEVRVAQTQDTYYVNIGSFPADTVVEYYVAAYDTLGNVRTTDLKTINIVSLRPDIISPENATYNGSSVLLNYTVGRDNLEWVGYSLDDQANVTTSHTITTFSDSHGAPLGNAYTVLAQPGINKSVYLRIPEGARVLPNDKLELSAVSSPYNRYNPYYYSTSNTTPELVYTENITPRSPDERVVIKNLQIRIKYESNCYCPGAVGFIVIRGDDDRVIYQSFTLQNNRAYPVTYSFNLGTGIMGNFNETIKVNYYLYSPRGGMGWGGTSYINPMNIGYLLEKRGPTGITITSDSSLSWYYPGPLYVLSSPVTVDLNSEAINKYLDSCSPIDGYCLMGLNITSLVKGTVKLQSLSVKYYDRTVPLTGLTDGSHSLRVYARDTSGNIGGSAVWFSVDSRPPVTVDDAPAGWRNADFTVNLSASDNGTDVRDTYYRVDEGLWTNGTSISIAEEGNHTIEYYSVDHVGNNENARVTAAALDKTSPEVNVSSPSPGDYSYRENLTIVFNASDALSGLSSLVAYLDRSNVTNGQVIDLLVLDVGDHLLEVVAVDNAGNNATKTVNFKVIDDIAPVSSDNADNDWHVLDVVVTLNASDVKSSVKEIRYSVNDGLEVAVAGNATNVTISIEGNNNTISYYAVDMWGNEEVLHFVEGIRLDKSPSAITIVSPESRDYSYTEDLAIEFNVTDNVSGVASLSAYLDDTPVTNGQVIDLFNFSLGKHVFTAVAFDNAGNNATSTVGLMVIDDESPVSTANANEIWHNSDIVVMIIAEDEKSAVQEIHYTVNEGSEVVVSGAATNATITYEDDNNTLRYYAIDEWGNVEFPRFVDGIKLDKTKPMVRLWLDPAKDEYYSDESLPVKYEAYDPVVQGNPSDNLTLIFDVDGVIVDDPSDMTSMIGTHLLTLTATDNAGNKASASIGFTVILRAEVNIDPDTLNLKSEGKWITGYIEFPSQYDAMSINVSTVTLNRVVKAEGDPKYDFVSNPVPVDKDGDGLAEFMVKFDRNSVEQILQPTETVTLSLKGEFAGGFFEGADVIRVIEKSNIKTDGASLKLNKHVARKDNGKVDVGIDLFAIGTDIGSVFVQEYIPGELVVDTRTGVFIDHGLIWDIERIEQGEKQSIQYMLIIPKVEVPTTYTLRTVVEYQTSEDLKTREETTYLTIEPDGQVKLANGESKDIVKERGAGYTNIDRGRRYGRGGSNEEHGKGQQKGHGRPEDPGRGNPNPGPPDNPPPDNSNQPGNPNPGPPDGGGNPPDNPGNPHENNGREWR